MRDRNVSDAGCGQLLVQAPLLIGVDCRGRFVQNSESRRVVQQARKAEALALASRQYVVPLFVRLRSAGGVSGTSIVRWVS